MLFVVGSKPRPAIVDGVNTSAGGRRARLLWDTYRIAARPKAQLFMSCGFIPPRKIQFESRESFISSSELRSDTQQLRTVLLFVLRNARTFHLVRAGL